MSGWRPKGNAYQRLVAVVLHRDGPHCRYCGRSAIKFGWRRDSKKRLRIYLPGFALDHVTPHTLGGPSTPGNLVLACDTCNQRKGTKPAGELLPPKPFVLGPSAHTLVRDDYVPGGCA